jgi:hypothetical protein
MQGDSTGARPSASILKVAMFKLRVFAEIGNRFVDLLQHPCLVSAEHATEHHVVGYVIAAKDAAIEFTGAKQRLHFLAQADRIQFFELTIELLTKLGHKFFGPFMECQHQCGQVIGLRFVDQARRRQRMLFTETSPTEAIEDHHRGLDAGSAGAQQSIGRGRVSLPLVDSPQQFIITTFGADINDLQSQRLKFAQVLVAVVF